VIVIERPSAMSARCHGVRSEGVGSSEASLDHWAFNRGKRSVALDPLGNLEDRAILDRLLAGADVLVESLDPADRAPLHLEPAQTAARFPQLVHASITGFGVSGPKAGWRSTDLVAMAAGGYLSMTGDDDRPPVRISLDQAFHHAAAGAVLIALRERIAVDGDEAWGRLAKELGRPDLVGLTLAERRQREEELEGLIDRWRYCFDEDELIMRLQELGVPAHSVQNSPELWRDAQLAHRGHFTRTDHAVHPGLVVEASRFVMSRSAPSS
jgi:crotonobetainyl-CoA:carnitine CoA-transferase CaiB-like acyl-CoA transferase